MAKSLKIITTLFLCLISFCIAEVSNPTGEVRKTSAKDFFRHPQKGDGYNEMWSYVFVLDNGAKVYVNYTWMSVPTQGFKIGTDFSIWNFKGKSSSVGRQYPTERFVENKNTNTISINNDDYLMEKQPGKGHRVLFSANKNGEKFLDLTFTSAVNGVVQNDGVFTVNGSKFGLYVHIPYGRVKGRIGIGKDTVEVQGYGYMDQTWQMKKPTDMATRMLNFSMPAADSFMAGRIGIDKNGNPFGYAINNSKGGIKIVYPTSVLENEKKYNPQKNPNNLTFTWSDSSVVPLKFETKPQEVFSILSNFDGFLERNAVKLALGDLRYRRGRSQTELGKLDWVIAGF